MSRWKAAGKAVIAATVVVLLPGLVLSALGASDLAGASGLAAIAAVIPTIRVGPRLGLVAAISLAVASALAIWASASALWAGLLMAAIAGLAAASARIGTSAAVVMVPISIVFLIVQPPTRATGGSAGALLVGFVVLASALWAVGSASVLARGHERGSTASRSASSWSRSGAYAIVLALVTGLAMSMVVALDLGHSGGWFVMTLLIVIGPYVQDALRKTWQRGLGTLLGFGIAIVASAVPSPTIRYVLGGICFVLALDALLVRHRPYWQYVTLLTPAVVLLEGSSGDVVATAVDRLVFTLLGVGLAVLVELALYPAYRGMANRLGVTRF